MITHASDSQQVPNQNKTKFQIEKNCQKFKFCKKLYMQHTFWSCLIGCIWNGSNQNCRHYRADAGRTDVVLTKCNQRGAILVTFEENQPYFRDWGGTLVVGYNVTCPVGFVACVCIFVIWTRSYKLHQSFLVHLLDHQKVLAGKIRWHPTQVQSSVLLPSGYSKWRSALLGYAIRRAPILVWPNMGKVGDNRRW